MIFLKNSEHIESIKKAGTILSDCLSFLSLQVKPGVTGLQLDKLAEDFIRAQGGIPTCLNYRGFPNSVCISVNSGAVHCIPNNKTIKEGDVVKLDLVVNYKGWNADSALTVLVPPVQSEVRKLAETTYTAMLLGVGQAIEGNRVSDISKAIYEARNEFGVIKEFCGHGIGRDIHEAPQISNVSTKKEKDDLLVAGMVLCIEPIMCIGDPSIFYDPKQWDTWVLSGNIVSHWEHTVLIKPNGELPEILTLRKEEKQNGCL
jgi:methionyl aminopeptidase